MLRILSPLETVYVDQGMTIVTVSDLVGTVNALTLQKAIAMGVTMHPLVASEIQSQENAYVFSPVSIGEEKIKMIGGVDKEKRKQAIISELNTPLELTRLIRCTLLLEERIGMLKPQAISLITTVHRAACDPANSIALQEQIWRIYAELTAQRDPELAELPSLPVEEGASVISLDDYQTAVKAAADQQDVEIEIAYVRKKFTIKQTEAIVEKCKQQNVSVQDAIRAAHATSSTVCAIGLNDLGVIKFPYISRKLKLTAMQMIPRTPLPVLEVSAIVSGNKLTVTYPYAKPFYSTNQIKKIADLTSVLL